MPRPAPNDVDEVLNRCDEAADEGQSEYDGESYEAGVAAGIRWMQGGEHPFDEAD